MTTPEVSHILQADSHRSKVNDRANFQIPVFISRVTSLTIESFLSLPDWVDEDNLYCSGSIAQV